MLKLYWRCLISCSVKSGGINVGQGNKVHGNEFNCDLENSISCLYLGKSMLFD